MDPIYVAVYTTEDYTDPSGAPYPKGALFMLDKFVDWTDRSGKLTTADEMRLRDAATYPKACACRIIEPPVDLLKEEWDLVALTFKPRTQPPPAETLIVNGRTYVLQEEV